MLDTLVTLRGDIAHRGSFAVGVIKGQVEQYGIHIKRLVACMEIDVAASGRTTWSCSASPTGTAADGWRSSSPHADSPHRGRCAR
ncbi:hypothetical protein ABZ924_21785 [Streptomyces sp. NPDC046876]|uniref:hypothetical protein n=1 Tax=Streptomyces sp. NPDC046876 TaxID=3155616 RepID=UPI0033CC3C21